MSAKLDGRPAHELAALVCRTVSGAAPDDSVWRRNPAINTQEWAFYLAAGMPRRAGTTNESGAGVCQVPARFVTVRWACIRASSPVSSAVGLGGQPGMYRSTGTTSATPPTTA